MAARHEDPNMVRMLLEKGVDVNAAHEVHGMTPLMRACWYGRMETVKVLLENGASIDAVNKEGKAAMDIAAERGHDEIMVVLLEAMG